MKLSDLICCIEDIAPLEIQEKYDNCGLLIGHQNDDVNKILLCLDVTEEVLNEAVTEDCDMIVSHHPLIFSAVKKIDGKSLIYQAIQHHIAIYAAHTNLDAAQFGVSTILAEKLGLKKVKVLRKSPVDERFGLGAIGEFDQPMSEENFLDLVKNVCKIPVVKHSKLRGKPVKTVALCGGGGSDLREDAIAQHADAYVSSDFKHHEYHPANTPILLVDAGHFETEQYAIDILYAELTKKFPNFAIIRTKTNNNPVFYR